MDYTEVLRSEMVFLIEGMCNVKLRFDDNDESFDLPSIWLELPENELGWTRFYVYAPEPTKRERLNLALQDIDKETAQLMAVMQATLDKDAVAKVFGPCQG